MFITGSQLPISFLKKTSSREDIEDLLSDPTYFQALFHSLPRVKAMYQAQAELGMANEAIASEQWIFAPNCVKRHVDQNTSLQQSLYDLRSSTKDAFNEAKSLEARWKELEREQKEVYQACSFALPTEAWADTTLQRFSPQFLLMRLRHSVTAQDDASEALASTFISQISTAEPVSSNGGTATPGGREIDDFVREFKALRKVYHKRVMWSERWGSGQVMWSED